MNFKNQRTDFPFKLLSCTTKAPERRSAIIRIKNLKARNNPAKQISSGGFFVNNCEQICAKL
jgi:hypothetical protein